jgi:hypothetical protein
MNDQSYKDILSYLKQYGGEKYKKLEKCKSTQEQSYMTSGAEAGKRARARFAELVDAMSLSCGLEKGKITQWQNSGTFVSYFWCQLKERKYIDDNISISLFAEKADGVFRFRVSVELAIESASQQEREKYKKILAPKGKIFFKTDNKGLFDYSLESFVANGFKVSDVCFDLHSDRIFNKDNIETEYEKNFSEKGFLINRLTAEVL